MSRWAPAPAPGANLVDVRAMGHRAQAARHYVERQPNQLVQQDAAALCGFTPSLGWVVGPSYPSGACSVCWRRAGRWRLAQKAQESAVDQS